MKETDADINLLSETILNLHFDIDDGSLRLHEFIIAAESAQEILISLNQIFFGDQIEIEVHVLPALDGSFLERLKIGMKVSGAFILGMLSPNIIEAVFHAETGSEITPAIEKSYVRVKEGVIDVIQVTPEVAGYILSETTKYFLVTNETQLREGGISKEALPQAFSARNNFYHMCESNPEIRGVGFTTEHEFPVNRDHFGSMQATIHSEPVENKLEQWKVEIVDIVVLSPYWVNDEDKKWRGRTKTKDEVKFSIQDEGFWKLVDTQALKVKIQDNVKVQWAYIEENGKRTKTKVMRVIEYNGAKISKPMSKRDLDIALGFQSPCVPDVQHELFNPVTDVWSVDPLNKKDDDNNNLLKASH